MAPHQQRVVDEKNELDNKLEKLVEFLDTQLFLGLPIEEKFRLRRQSVVMDEYSNILAARIGAF